jgi:glucose-6-phosphate dehydrogenase assembly protein OpcA
MLSRPFLAIRFTHGMEGRENMPPRTGVEEIVMSPTTATDSVPLSEIEHELRRQTAGAKDSGEAPTVRARMSNLVIFCDRADTAESLAAEVPTIVAAHPARVLLLIGEPGPETVELTASVRVWNQRSRAGLKACSEQVTLRARGQAVDRLPFAVRGLLVGDLPINIWWASTQPPPLAGMFLYSLAEQAQQVIYDSIGWPEPALGVAATAAWLGNFERGIGDGRWRVASDLNWRRLKFWRRLLGQTLDPSTASDLIGSVTEVLVEHGPHAVIQAWLLVSWLASRLGWEVQAGSVQPGVEITWQVLTPHGPLRVRIRRQAEGPTQLRRMRLACVLDGKPCALDIAPEDDRLVITAEGLPLAARTLTVQPQTLVDLVARQLSDRERDAVFHESMDVAQVFAKSLLG